MEPRYEGLDVVDLFGERARQGGCGTCRRGFGGNFGCRGPGDIALGPAGWTGGGWG